MTNELHESKSRKSPPRPFLLDEEKRITPPNKGDRASVLFDEFNTLSYPCTAITYTLISRFTSPHQLLVGKAERAC